MTVTRALIAGVGGYLPEKIVTNRDLESTLDTTHEWIVERTGIVERHIAAEGELTSDLAARAITVALSHAKLAPSALDTVILATTTPDDTVPSTASKVQHKIGAANAAAFDLNAACAGFVYALKVADALIVSGRARTIAIAGAEIFSRIVDWKDRGTCILFGDGAGAVIVQAGEGEGNHADRGILRTDIFTDGSLGDILKTTGGVATTGTAGTLVMAGREVFRHAVDKMARSVEESLQAVGLNASDIDWLIPHQANARILEAIAKKLDLPMEKVISTVDKHANTSAASIPLALYDAVNKGKIHKGALLALPALGAGLTWGTCVIRY